MYASLFGISGALHLAVFEQPVRQVFFSNLLGGNAITKPDAVENQQQKVGSKK
jgi:hypothetical protein